MGAIQDGGILRGSAIGVMPNMLNEREISTRLSELILIDSMHERKTKWQIKMRLSWLQRRWFFKEF